MYKLKLSWNDLDRLCLKLSAKVLERYKQDDFRPDTIVAVGRGGFVPARLLADVLGVGRLASLQVGHYSHYTIEKYSVEIIFPLPINFHGHQVLLVDDIANSGKSLFAVVKHLQWNAQGSNFPLRVATIHSRPKSIVKPDYYAETVPEDVWVVYPWERFESTMGEKSENIREAIMRGMRGLQIFPKE